MIKKDTKITVKYNRVSTILQTGNRFQDDTKKYDLVLLDKTSGSVPFDERPKAKILIDLINQGRVETIVIEELSRLGRNTGDVIKNLEWMEKQNINVIVRNLGIESRPNNQRNPIWKMITSVMSSIYEMEVENIKERTSVGRKVFVQNGGTLGRPVGTTESDIEFLRKPNSVDIAKELSDGQNIRRAAKQTGPSTKTVMKVKKLLLLKCLTFMD